MDLEDAILLEGERIDGLELRVQHAACRIAPFERRTRVPERRVEPFVVNQEDPAARVGDLHGAVGENILLGDVCPLARRPVDFDEVSRADGGRI